MVVVVVNSKVRPRIRVSAFLASDFTRVGTMFGVMFAHHSASANPPSNVDAQRGFNKRAGIKARSARSRMSS